MMGFLSDQITADIDAEIINEIKLESQLIVLNNEISKLNKEVLELRINNMKLSQRELDLATALCDLMVAYDYFTKSNVSWDAMNDAMKQAMALYRERAREAFCSKEFRLG